METIDFIPITWNGCCLITRITVNARVLCELEEFDYLIRRPFSRPGNQIAGFSVGITLLGNTFIGAPTSCPVFPSRNLEKDIPLPIGKRLGNTSR